MRLFDKVEMLQLQTVLAGGPGVIHPLLLWDDQDVVLIDTGLPGMAASIQDAAKQTGIPFERLNRILITHADMDHIGSLSQIIHEAAAGITLLAHKEEKPYIECELPPVRLKQMEAAVASLSGTAREKLSELTENLRHSYRTFEAKVDRTIEDGEVLPFCGGITCIHTPGHTLGHMSFYLESLKLLIAGDVLQLTDGVLTECPDFTTVDRQALTASLEKLSRYAIETVVCYHGGLLQGDVSRRIAEIAGSL